MEKNKQQSRGDLCARKTSGWAVKTWSGVLSGRGPVCGKTIFTQGFAAGLGIDEPVNSPTFTIVQQYDSGRLPLYHFDVYRIGDVE